MAVSYVYFDYKDRNQTAKNVISCLFRQLVSQLETIPPSFQELSRQELSKLDTPALIDMLKFTSQQFRNTFVLFDALDECDASEQEDVLDFICQLKNHPSCSVFLTSRPHLRRIRSLAASSSTLNIRADDLDIQTYVRDRLKKEGYLAEEFKHEIIEKLQLGAKGM